MADYWKSQGRKFCDFCKCWIADNKPSIKFHEGGKKHKENVSKKLKEIHKNSAKQAKQARKFEDDLKQMENAAMAAYLKDVESNNVDLTAEKIMREKKNKISETPKTENPNQMPSASTDTIPRFAKNRNYRENSRGTDFSDPYVEAKRNYEEAKLASQSVPTTSNSGSGEHRPHGKSNKPGRDKRKGAKKLQEDESTTARPKPVEKLWYEARTSEGYTYYWHIRTNESVWEEPVEEYMTLAEQEEEAKEAAIQAEFLDELDKEQSKEKAEILEEQRANAERENFRRIAKLRKGEVEKNSTKYEKEETGNCDDDDEDSESEYKIPYRRDYSVPEKPDPYGPWQTVEIKSKKAVDLELPKKKSPVVIPIAQTIEPPAQTKRVFVEKVVTSLSIGDSDDEEIPTTFKKRKFGAKNVRKRFNDD